MIYIGKFIPPELLKTAKEDSRGVLGMSNHNFEMSIIHGLSRQDVDITFVSLPGVYSYPRYNRRMWIPAEKFEIEGYKGYSAGYFNLIGINRRLRTNAVAKILRRVIRQSEGNSVEVIVNPPSGELLKAIEKTARSTAKDIKTTLIIPDIPAFVSAMNATRGIVGKIIGRRDRETMEAARRCDRLVLLTEQMMDFFNPETPHIVMEGLVDVETMTKDEEQEGSASANYFLYTGTLRRIFGVMNLVDAFEKANIPGTELWICGSGETAEEIQERARKNPAIKFLGLVDSKTALRLQRGAMALVNPRTSEGEYTKYSFPSKTLEYLLAGKPVIANSLPGIPAEYKPYIISAADESVAALADTMRSVASMPEDQRLELGRRGKQFVIDNKNSNIQVGRILDLIENGH